MIIAPDADADAKRILSGKKNLRLLLAGGLPDPRAQGWTFKTVAGGFLVQTRDNAHTTRADLKVVTKRQPTETELTDMLFAFTIGKHVKSNTIVYAKNGVTAGIGAGQMSRVDSARIAAIKAKDAAQAAGWAEPMTKGSAAASDAFFPFADGLLAVAEAGATAVIQPGGSVRDDEVIKAADEAGFPNRDIVSGAGHDAGYVARVAPVGMVFVPCADGISHNEVESALPEDLAAGCNVLMRAMLELAA